MVILEKLSTEGMKIFLRYPNVKNINLRERRMKQKIIFYNGYHWKEKIIFQVFFKYKKGAFYENFIG